jgi:hypothetical protein
MNARDERVHAILERELAGDVPHLSPDFHRRVVTAARRRGRRLDGAWRCRLMLAYWLSAAVGGYLALALSWPTSLDALDWMVVGGSLTLLAVPFLILRSLLRADLVELWFRTVE